MPSSSKPPVVFLPVKSPSASLCFVASCGSGVSKYDPVCYCTGCSRPLLQSATVDAKCSNDWLHIYLGAQELALQLLHRAGAFAQFVDNIWARKCRLSLQWRHDICSCGACLIACSEHREISSPATLLQRLRPTKSD